MADQQKPPTFQPRPTLWSRISKQLRPSEVENARAALGSSVVQRNEELARECEGLFRVWGDFRQSSDGELRAAAPSPSPSSRLPEPPNQREWLLSQIKFHIENFRSAAKEAGVGSVEELLPLETPRDRAVFRYATKKPAPARPASAPGPQDDPHLIDTRQCSSARIALPKANLARMLSDPALVEELRRALEDEHQVLLGDAEFLRLCIEQETSWHRHAIKEAKKATADEPAIGEMREWNAKLEKAWLEGSGRRRPQTASSSAPGATGSPVGRRPVLAAISTPPGDKKKKKKKPAGNPSPATKEPSGGGASDR